MGHTSGVCNAADYRTVPSPFLPTPDGGLVMAHPLDRAIASDLSQQVIELRRLRGELTPPALDNAHRIAYRVSGYRPFIPDVEDGTDAAQPNPLERATVWEGQ